MLHPYVILYVAISKEHVASDGTATSDLKRGTPGHMCQPLVDLVDCPDALVVAFFREPL
jgi:hypothetical protein